MKTRVRYKQVTPLQGEKLNIFTKRCMKEVGVPDAAEKFWWIVAEINKINNPLEALDAEKPLRVPLSKKQWDRLLCRIVEVDLGRWSSGVFLRCTKELSQ